MRWSGLAALTLAVVVSGCQSSPPPESPAPSAVGSRPAVGPAARGTIDVRVIQEVPLTMASRIVDVALTHAPTAGVHIGQEFEVTEVSAVDGESFGDTGDHVRVVIEFTDALPPDVWPPNEAVCDVDRESNDITGIAWLLSLDTGSVEAYSPQWDYAIDCEPA
jgi:hypothetical protein